MLEAYATKHEQWRKACAAVASEGMENLAKGCLEKFFRISRLIWRLATPIAM